MTVEQEKERIPRVIDTFSADPRSQNRFGMPISQVELRGRQPKNTNINPIPTFVAGLLVTGLIALGLRQANTVGPPPDSHPTIPGETMLAGDTESQRYTGEITVKLSPELNIRTSPQITERNGARTFTWRGGRNFTDVGGLF